jgi:hypothetical protein
MTSARVYIEVSEAGVLRTHVDATDAAEATAAHSLLAKLSFEIRALDIAAKTVSDPEADSEGDK